MSSLWIYPWSRPTVPAVFDWPMLGADDFTDAALSHFMDFDRSLEAVDQEMKRLRRNMDTSFRNSQRQLASALTNLSDRPSTLMEHRSMLNPIQTDAEGNRTLKCCFDMRSFKPEEVNVTFDTKTRCIQVEGNHEVKDDQNRHVIKRHYLRHFYLPEDATPDPSKLELKSCLSNEGILCIEAPLPKLPKVEAPPAQQQTSVQPAPPTPIEVKKI